MNGRCSFVTRDRIGSVTRYETANQMTDPKVPTESDSSLEEPTAARVGRPAKHASAADRQKAYRATKAAAVLTKDQAETLDKIAGELDTTRAAVLESMVRFALMNRDWRRLGLM